MGIHRGIERKSHDESGFTMVEVMVALVVLAVGLLGIAALLLKSLQSGRTATYRTQAVNLAADLCRHPGCGRGLRHDRRLQRRGSRRDRPLPLEGRDRRPAAGGPGRGGRDAPGSRG
jgi:prepilin-type N-terminal cleavage/methylation domain-containing protein